MNLTLIIPVYNSSETIIPLLQSVLKAYRKYNGKFEEHSISLLFIDDGSTDDSVYKINDFLKSDNKFYDFKILSQSNSGVSVARNIAINEAKTKYITFVDSDDSIHEDFFESLHQVLTNRNLDILKYDLFIVNNNNIRSINVYDSVEIIPYTQLEVLKELFTIEDERHFGFAAGKIYNTEFIKTNEIKFDSDIHYSEDTLFLIDAVLRTSNIYYLPKQLYYYERESNNPTFLKRYKTLEEDLKKFHSSLTNKLKHLLIENKQVYYSYLNYRLSSIIMLALANKKMSNKYKFDRIYKDNLEHIKLKYVKKANFRSANRKIIYVLLVFKQYSVLNFIFNKFYFKKIK